MDREMVLINEGFVLDDAGNMIATTYIDLRQDGERTAIPALVRGCRREHALEDGETILISKPARFREYGEELIQDDQEGFAKEESVTVAEETAAQATRMRVVEDINEARELTGSRVRMIDRVTYSKRDTKSKNLSYGKEWWIFCTAIRPNDEEWEAWRATLPENYDHVSEIGQPAKFAEALARMVTEQIGPQGKRGWFKHTTEGGEVVRTKHRLQWVIHGPVIYTDRVYDALTGDYDGTARVAASIFTKSTKYAAQREYRFAVLNEGADEETVILRISGMMRDALKRTEGGLIRIAPAQAVIVGNNMLEPSSRTRATQTPVYERATTTERLTTREERRSETRTPDGQVISSDGERQERISERTVTQKNCADDENSPTTERMERVDDVTTLDQSGQLHEQQRGGHDRDASEEEAVKEIALEEREWKVGGPRDSERTVAVHSGTGRIYRSIEDMLHDPALPTSPASRTRQEAASSPEEIATTYGVIEVLALKMADIREEYRQDVASAGWHAMYCIRNIYARFGDIVDSVWIERERFVVLRLKESRELNAAGRIVVSPSGAYAYCIKLFNSEVLGDGGEQWGTMFFPMGTQIENFETYGWAQKAN